MTADAAWWEPEVYSMLDPRFVEHRWSDVEALLAIREAVLDEAPVAIEIGSHRAAFVEGMACTHAPAHVLGIEWRRKYHRLGLERVDKRAVKNARLVCANARLAIPILIPPASLDAVYVTFPDPWWKKRHADRRVLDPLFMRVIARRLKPKGRLYVKSDVFDYLYRLRDFAAASEAFRPLPAEHWPDETTWTLTTRERKCMRGAIPFGRGYYQRLDGFPTDLPSEVEENIWDVETDAEMSGESIIKGPPPVDVEHRALQAKLRAEMGAGSDE